MYLFFSLKARQSSILWSVLCRFHTLYHCCHLLSLIAICCHSLSLVVLLTATLCHLLFHSTRCHSLSFVITCCHSLSLVVTRCHSLSLVVPLVVIRCHSLYHSLSLVVIRCHSLYHSLSLVVIRCHSLSLDVPLVCLFINDHKSQRRSEFYDNTGFNKSFNTEVSIDDVINPYSQPIKSWITTIIAKAWKITLQSVTSTQN